MRMILCIALIVSTLLFGASANAGEPDASVARDGVRFGGDGTVTISGDFNIRASRLTLGSSDLRTTSFELKPSADAFVVGGLSIGGGVLIGHSDTNDLIRAWTLGMGARIGYAQRLAERVVVWPRATASYARTWPTCGPNPCIGGGAWLLQLHAPIIIEPARHMFVGMGPMIVHRPRQDNMPSATEYGAQSVVGGWF
jgi:hypothetical protein